ncbi:MAG TPA: hypothetical protein VFA20_01440, partial [Myxococcaceae bacterium]|nr:hypothetical protein [Myxococcaceae bacterium]
KVHPLTIAGGLILGATSGITVLSLPVELEYAITPNVSVFGQVAPLYVTSAIGSGAGILLGGGARAYPFGEALRGFWVGGLVAGGVASNLSFDLQAQAGWAWVFDNGFYLSVGGSISFAGLLAGAIPIGVLVPIGFAF